MLFVCGCVCLQKHKAKKIKKGPEHVEGRTKCTAEVHGGSNKKAAQTHDCTAVQAMAIHKRFIQNKKTAFLLVLYKPHHTK
ncbi:hypothetical protein TCDM_11880 [Trypanosoma cruzi Dm28c]|uniref:Uncharacterized protein n=1 Tax=Trypanosoma cruzi Dm28c TaxID=1416333 RepID=V5CZF1_TRYCR|nr:hypothetical protein TCDM_11880 [Trypanosoma cruzi Dm28c]